jgi:hypothetical protein
MKNSLKQQKKIQSISKLRKRLKVEKYKKNSGEQKQNNNSGNSDIEIEVNEYCKYIIGTNR